MTVSSSARRAGPFLGNGVASAFSFNFKVFAASDIAVYITDANGVQTLTTNIFVVVNPDQDASPGGTVNYPLTGGVFLPAGSKLDIVGTVDYTQGTDLTNVGRFLPDVIEKSLDRLTILAQQLREWLGRAVSFPVGDTASATLPAAANRANKALIFDASGNVGVSVDDYDDQLANVTAQASIATTKAGEAAGSAAAASTSAGQAATSATNAEGSRQAIDTRIYPGTYAADPLSRPDGTPRQNGDVYFTTGNVPKVYGGGVWAQVTGASAADLASTDPTKGTALVGTIAGALKTVLAVPQSAGITSNSNGALAFLKKSLKDDFCADVNIRFVGDSITWGLTATGNGTQNPRSHALTDVRDVLTSASWVNKLRDYLGKAYTGGVLVDSGNGVGSYTKTVKMSVESNRIAFTTAAGSAVAKTIITNAGHVYGTAMDIVGGPSGLGIEFGFTGSSLTIIYTQIPASTSYELFVDGVSQGTFSTAGATAFNISRTHNFAPGSHTIRFQNNDPNAANAVRVAGFTWTKTVKVANDGLIGTNTDEWLPTGSILPGSIATSDEYVLVMLGTNDRAQTTVPTTTARTTQNLRSICNYLTGLGKKVVLMAPNAVTENEAANKFTQNDVASAVVRVARDLTLDVIDLHRATEPFRQSGLSYLADGLHPNDFGHEAMFKAIVHAIERAPEALAYPTMQVDILSKLARQTFTLTANAVPTGKSNQNFTLAWSELPTLIVGAVLRVKQSGGTYGSLIYSMDPGDNPGQGVGEPATAGGAPADIDVTAWVMRIFHQNGTNCRLGFVNNTGAAKNMVVELTVAYLKSL